MTSKNKTIKASIELKHLNPAFYLKDTKQVIDPVIKGLKTGITVTSAGSFVCLKSEMQITHLNKRKTIRNYWYNGKHNLPLTSTELLQIKIKADQWYQDNKQKSDYKLCYLSEIYRSFLKDPEVTQGTNQNRRSALLPIQDRFSKIEINEITTEVLLSFQEGLLNYPKWNNSSKLSAINRLTQFIAFAFRKTKNKKVAIALTEFNLLKEKIKKNESHVKTLESVSNEDLKEKLIQSFQIILKSKTRYQNEMFILFLLPMRLSEVLSITPDNTTKNNIFIEKTKTIKINQGGFNIPINEKVYSFLKDNKFKDTSRRALSNRFKKLTDFTVHGIRSIFSDYMTRQGFQWNLIESCLSHKTSNSIAQCYHRDQKNYFYEQRKPLMYYWYDFIFDCMEQAKTRNSI